MGFSSIVVSLIAVFVALLGYGVISNANPTSGTVVFCFTLLAVVTVSLGRLAQSFGKRHRDRKQRRIANSTGASVLFLRPFEFDVSTVATQETLFSGLAVAHDVTVAFEEELSARCYRHGMTLKAIGPTPGQYGPSSVSVSDAGWRDLALGMLSDARLVVIMPSSSEGTFWELTQILGDRALAEKTVLVLPPQKMCSESLNIELLWARVSEACRTKLHMPFPRFDPGGLVFGYARTASTGDWRVVVRRFSWTILENVVQTAGA